MPIHSYIRWTARILAALMVIFGLVFLLGHLFGSEDNSSGFRSTAEFLSFLCFPVSTMIGLSMAWKWEGIGACITLVGMLGLLLLRPDLLTQPLILAPLLPALLFGISWYLHKEQALAM